MVKLELKKGKLVYLIGLTGNIACGKSAVLELLAQRGAQVIDADRVVHRLMEPGGTIYGLVVEQFGEDILGETDTQGKRVIDRRKLGAIVFTEDRKSTRLNSSH